MTEPADLDRFEGLVRRIFPGAMLRRAWRLTGGVSAEITALEIERPDEPPLKLVVRRHGVVDLAHNPRVARDEFALLRIVRTHGVAAPEPCLVDESGELFPTPVVVVAFVNGEPVFEPDEPVGFVERAVAELVRIHAIEDSPELAFLPRQESGIGERPEHLDLSMGEDRIRDALEAAWPVAQANGSVLLHGDFWPGNLLWQDGELAAVIDWEDANVGDPLADLANARLEFLMAYGPAAMDDLTDRYRVLRSIDVTNLPYWDLRAALRHCGKLADWGLEEATERRMRVRHAAFVAQGIDALTRR